MNNCRPPSKDRQLHTLSRNPQKQQDDYQQWAKSYGKVPPPPMDLHANRFEVRNPQSSIRDKRPTSNDKLLSARLRDLAAAITSSTCCINLAEFVVKKGS